MACRFTSRGISTRENASQPTAIAVLIATAWIELVAERTAFHFVSAKTTVAAPMRYCGISSTAQNRASRRSRRRTGTGEGMVGVAMPLFGAMARSG